MTNYSVLIDNAVVRVSSDNENVDIHCGTVQAAQELAKDLTIAKLNGEWK